MIRRSVDVSAKLIENDNLCELMKAENESVRTAVEKKQTLSSFFVYYHIALVILFQSCTDVSYHALSAGAG